MLLDLRAGPLAGDEAQPVAAGAGVLGPRDQDLADVAVGELAVEGHQPPVDAGPDAAVADLGVDRVGEIDRRRALRQRDHVALRGEDVDLGGIQFETQRVEEFAGILGLTLPLVQLVHPTQLGVVGGGLRGRRALGRTVARLLLVLPVRGDTVFGAAVHVLGADLELDRPVARPQHRGVQRLVHVVLRQRDVVLEAPRQRVPAGVQDAERAVAVAGGVDQHPQPDQVVDVGELATPHHHLLVDRVVVLGATVDGGLDAGLVQVTLGLIDHLTQLAFALRCGLGDHPDDLVVDLGLQGGEREILEFPLDGVHAEPVGQRGEDLEGVMGDAALLVGTQEAERSHIVQPVTELDDQHPHVLGGGDHQLADRLGLRRFTVGELVELGHPVDQQRDLFAEIGPQLVDGVAGVLDGVVQQGRAQCGRGHAQFSQDRGDRQRVGDVGLPRLAGLAAMVVLGGVVGPLEFFQVGLGMVGLDHREERIEHRRLGRPIGLPEAGQPLPHPHPGLLGAAGDPVERGRMGRAGRPLAGPIGTVDGLTGGQGAPPPAAGLEAESSTQTLNIEKRSATPASSRCSRPGSSASSMTT